MKDDEPRDVVAEAPEEVSAALSNDALKSRAPRLERGVSCGDALATCATAASQQILWNWGAAISGGDEETVHQMRVATRRFRVAIRAFRAERVDEAWGQISDRLKALIAVTGKVRDLDVLACDVVLPLDRVSVRPDLADLIAKLNGARREAKAELIGVLATPEWMAFRSRLAVWPTEMAKQHSTDPEATEHSARKAGNKELKRLWKRIEEATSSIDTLDNEQRHALRKDLRRLRYAIDLLAPLHERHDSGRMLTEIRRLQLSLGHLNDVSVAKTLLEMPTLHGCGDASIHRAAGFVIGWHGAKSEDSWGETVGSLERLRKCEPFWN